MSSTGTNERRLIEQRPLVGVIGLPVFGTCAGLIILACAVVNAEALAEFERAPVLDIIVRRNAYGRQRESFTAPISVSGIDPPVEAVFIRAPQIEDAGAEGVCLPVVAQPAVGTGSAIDADPATASAG